MPDPGFEISTPFVQDTTDLSPTVQTMTANFDELEYLAGWWSTAGTRTFVVDVQYPQATYSGFEITAFSDLFYNRIWVIPAFVDLNGAPLNFTTEVIVWNSYFITKNLTSIIPTNDFGLSLAGPTSHAFNALETVSYTLSLLPGVPPKVDANYQFIFSDAEDPFLFINGTLSDVIVLPHDWNTPVIERVAYLTDVIEANSSKEQRIRMRKYPRRQYEYSIWTAVNDLPLEHSLLKTFYHNKLAYGIGKTFVVPIWTDYQILSQDLNVGATSVPVTTGNYDYFVGGYVAIIRDYITYDILSISAVNSSSLTIASPGTTKQWKIGDTIVPVRLAEVGEDLIKGSARTHNFETVTELWDVLVTDKLVGNRIVNNSPAYTYLNYEVYMSRNNFAQDQNIEIYSTLRKLDNNTGIPKIDARYSYAKERTALNLGFKNRLEFSEFLGFLERRQGKLNPFWLPTFANDFQVINSGGVDDKAFDIKFIGYSQYIKQNPIRRDIMIVTKAGQVLFRRITASADNLDGTENIVLDNSLGITWTPDTFDFICYLRWVRLDNDVTEIRWEQSTGAATSLSVIDLLNSV